MIDFIIGIGIGITIALFGVIAYAQWQIKRLQLDLSKRLTELEKSAAEEQAVDDRIRVRGRLEEANGIFYVFESESGKFLAQGSSSREIATHLDLRYPDGIILNIVEDIDGALHKLKSVGE